MLIPATLILVIIGFAVLLLFSCKKPVPQEEGPIIERVFDDEGNCIAIEKKGHDLDFHLSVDVKKLTGLLDNEPGVEDVLYGIHGRYQIKVSVGVAFDVPDVSDVCLGILQEAVKKIKQEEL